MARKAQGRRAEPRGATAARGTSISRPNEQKRSRTRDDQPDIPRTDIGIADTVRWKLDIGPLVDWGYAKNAVLFDLHRPSFRMDWTEKAIVGKNDAGELRRFVRLRDRARISIYPRSIALEVSVPRSIGYLNSDQDRVRAGDTCQTLRDFRALFPLTMFHAQRKSGREPFCTRLDLAINFEADMPKLIEAYRQAKHPGVRKPPDTFGATGIGWYGSRMQVVMYEPAKNPGRSRLARRERAKRVALPPGVVRLEVRFMTAETVARAMAELQASAGTIPASVPHLPCLATREKGTAGIAHVPITNHELHRQLMREVLRFVGGRSLRIPEGKGNLLRRLGLRFLAENPEYMVEVDESYSRPRASQVRREVAALQFKNAATDIIGLAWPGPRSMRSVRRQESKAHAAVPRPRSVGDRIRARSTQVHSPNELG